MTTCAGWARCKDGTQFASFRTRTASPPSRTVNKQTNKTNINSSYLRYFVHAVKHRQCEYKSCLGERFMWLSSGLTFLLSRSLMESATASGQHCFSSLQTYLKKHFHQHVDRHEPLNGKLRHVKRHHFLRREERWQQKDIKQFADNVAVFNQQIQWSSHWVQRQTWWN